MKDTLKILFATDFSKSSRVALDMLLAIKKKIKTKVLLIHVIPSFWKNWFASGLYQKEALQRLESWQKKLVGKIDKKGLFVELGNRSNAILSKANSTKANLILLASKSDQSEGRYKSGSTAENVVRHSKKSVLICKNKSISNILCGIDGSTISGKGLAFAIDFARQFKAKLTVVYVISRVDGGALGMSKKEVLAEEDKIEEDYKNKIEKFFKKFDFSGVKVEKEFKWGVPSHVMLDTAEDNEHDMIIVGAKGHSKLRQVLIGSTAEKVLRFAPCSLLVVR